MAEGILCVCVPEMRLMYLMCLSGHEEQEKKSCRRRLPLHPQDHVITWRAWSHVVLQAEEIHSESLVPLPGKREAASSSCEPQRESCNPGKDDSSS